MLKDRNRGPLAVIKLKNVRPHVPFVPHFDLSPGTANNRSLQ
jgi:hypothetical protein